MQLTLDTPVGALYSVGKTTAKKLEKLGITKAEDLLFYIPNRYEDYSEVKPISDVKDGETTTIQGKIELIENKRSYRKRWIVTSALVSDDTDSIQVVWFHQPYLTRVLKPGMLVSLAGKIGKAYEGGGLQMSNPVYESMQIKNGKAILSFSNIGSGLVAKGDKLTGFAIAGEDQKFVWADAEIQGEKIVVSNPTI